MSIHCKTWLMTLLLLSPSVSWSVEPFDDFDDDVSFEQIDQMLDNQFQHTDQQLDENFERINQAINNAFNSLTRKIERTWHRETKVPTQAEWVTYTNDLKARSIINYETGSITVERIIENKVTANDVAAIKQQFSELLSTPEQTLHQQDIFRQVVEKAVQKEIKQQVAENTLAKRSTLAIEQPIKAKEKPQTQTTKTQPSTTHTASKELTVPVTEKAVIAENNAPSTSLQPATKLSQLASIAPATLASVSLANLTTTAATVATAKTLENLASSSNTKDGQTKHQPKPQQNNQGIKAEITAKKPNTQPTKHIELVKEKAAQIRQEQRKQAQAAEPTLTYSENNGVKKLTLSLPFVNNFHKLLVESNLKEIKQLSVEYKIPVSIILAIIETESSFNPNARSPIPAFGLMQLVPRTAGVDAYQFVHGEKQIITPEYLYNIENNLELGTAYLHILLNRYLRRIDDQLSRFYCAVASYNTGVGNLAKTFIGTKNIKNAAKEINKLSPEEVYDYLLANLPATETKNYLKKIVKRKQKYEPYDQI